MRFWKQVMLRVVAQGVRIVHVPVALLLGYKTGRVGNCRVRAPEEKLPMIMSGFDHLKALDEASYTQITSSSLVFWYHPKVMTRCGRIFTITDAFLVWKLEGVVALLVQSAADVQADAIRQNASPARYREANHWVRDETFKWLSQHKVDSELVSQFRPNT